jgi:integrase
MLDTCNRKNARFLPNRTPFFVSGLGRRIKGGIPALMFKRIWDDAGLPRPEGGKQPVPYSFRHRFAYANIERWAAEGKDVAAMMPYLMRYMGHSSIKSTYYYLHISPNFMAGYAEQVAASSSVLPEVGFND